VGHHLPLRLDYGTEIAVDIEIPRIPDDVAGGGGTVELTDAGVEPRVSRREVGDDR
jgi:hypothetical protein